jgi:hypothetical protein
MSKIEKDSSYEKNINESTSLFQPNNNYTENKEEEYNNYSITNSLNNDN